MWPSSCYASEHLCAVSLSVAFTFVAYAFVVKNVCFYYFLILVITKIQSIRSIVLRWRWEIFTSVFFKHVLQASTSEVKLGRWPGSVLHMHQTKSEKSSTKRSPTIDLPVTYDWDNGTRARVANMNLAAHATTTRQSNNIPK